MEFISDDLLKYCERNSQKEDELLKELNRETHLKVGQARMLSGHLQGRVLSFLSKILQPACILEIGTYTGYSALCLAEGLKEKGKLISLDPNEETSHFAQKFISQSIYKDKIELRIGDAGIIIPTLNLNFDLVFIDADKKNYAKYYDLVIGKVNKGGLILADNVLWSGKILDSQKDKETQLIDEFNQKVNFDPQVETIVLPIRDGLSIIRKL